MRPQPTIRAAVSLGETTCSHAAAAMSPNAKPARPATSAAANVARRKIESSKAETPSMARPYRSEQRLDGVPSDGEAADPQVTLAQASCKQAISGYPAKKFLSAVAQLAHGNRHASDRFLRAQGAQSHISGDVMKSLLPAVAAIAVLAVCNPASAQSNSDVLQRLEALEGSNAKLQGSN